jgi:hypothetical protein
VARRLLQVPVGDGSDGVIEVEVDTRDLGGSLQLATDDGVDFGTAPFTIASSVGRVMPALSTILTRVRSGANAPDEIGMEIGLAFGGETGLFFAKGTAEATFTLTITWRKPDTEDARAVAPSSRAPGAASRTVPAQANEA